MDHNHLQRPLTLVDDPPAPAFMKRFRQHIDGRNLISFPHINSLFILSEGCGEGPRVLLHHALRAQWCFYEWTPALRSSPRLLDVCPPATEDKHCTCCTPISCDSLIQGGHTELRHVWVCFCKQKNKEVPLCLLARELIGPILTMPVYWCHY